MKAVTGKLVLDEHIAKVLEFMEKEIPADRLEYVATQLPAVARVLWAGDRCALLERTPLSATQPIASECNLVPSCAGDGSVAAGDTARQM